MLDTPGHVPDLLRCPQGSRARWGRFRRGGLPPPAEGGKRIFKGNGRLHKNSFYQCVVRIKRPPQVDNLRPIRTDGKVRCSLCARLGGRRSSLDHARAMPADPAACLIVEIRRSYPLVVRSAPAIQRPLVMRARVARRTIFVARDRNAHSSLCPRVVPGTFFTERS